MYESEKGGKRVFTAAASHRDLRAAEQGNANAQNNLGRPLLPCLGVRQDYVQALLWYSKAAARGLAEAENNLGVLYEKGLGVDKDYSRALALYTAAANQGARRAQYNLGMLYSAGRGVPLDYVSAYLWLGRSAAAGDALAAESLKSLTAIMMSYQKLLALTQLANQEDASIATSQEQSPFIADAANDQWSPTPLLALP